MRFALCASFGGKKERKEEYENGKGSVLATEGTSEMNRVPVRQYPEKNLDRNLSSGVALADLAPWVNNHARAGALA